MTSFSLTHRLHAWHIPTTSSSQVMSLRAHRALLAFAGAAATLALSTAWIALRGIDHRYIVLSDGVYSYTASWIAAHGPSGLYTQLVAAQPPLVLLGAAGVWRVNPSVEALRTAIAICNVATALLTWGLARRCGLGRGWAVLAGSCAIVMPVSNQYRGLDGEVLLAPLLVAATWLCVAGRARWIAAACAVGLMIKLTWVMAIPALLWNVRRRDGIAAAVTTAGIAVALAAGAWTALCIVFGWRISDVVDQLVMAQTSSGAHLYRVTAKAHTLLGMWWPFLLLAAAGVRQVPVEVRRCLLAGIAFLLFTYKSGTILNVMSPAEPLLALVAVAGLSWLVGLRPQAFASRAGMVVVVTLAVALVGVRTGTIVSPALAHAAQTRLVSAAILSHTQTSSSETSVNEAVSEMRAYTSPDQQVVADPLVALLAHRELVAQQPDWFLLHALHRYCDGAHDADTVHCTTWHEVSALAMSANVIQLNFNVGIFAPVLAHNLKDRHTTNLLDVHQHPLTYSILARVPQVPQHAKRHALQVRHVSLNRSQRAQRSCDRAMRHRCAGDVARFQSS